MKLIPLSQGKFAKVDDHRFEELSDYKWHVNGCGYATTQRATKRIYMHRMVNNTPKDKDTDHINHDVLDNRECNLRTVTTSQNLKNMSPRKNSTSQYKGVNLRKDTGRWRARIHFNGMQVHLGYFKTEKEAAIAYNKMALEQDSEHAYTNKI